jgi:hypothetical protein
MVNIVQHTSTDDYYPTINIVQHTSTDDYYPTVNIRSTYKHRRLIILCLVQQIGPISLIFYYKESSVLYAGLTLTAIKFRPHIDLDNIYQFKYYFVWS